MLASEESQKRNSFQGFLSNILWSLISTVFLVIAGFVVNIFVGNELGEELFGVYSLAATIYILVGMVSFIGVPYSLTKYTAEFIDNKEINTQYYTASIIVVFVSTSIGGILLYLLRFSIADLFNIPEFMTIIPVIALGLPFLGIYKTGISRLNGMREMRRMAIADTIRYILFFILTIVFVTMLSDGLFWAVFSIVLSDILICPYILWTTKVFNEWNTDHLKERLLRLGWFGSRVVLSRIVEELDVRSSLLLVGLFLSKTDLGLYSLASMIATAISIIPQAVQKVTGPAMTEMFASNRIDMINSMINQVMKLSVFLLTIIACFLVLFFDHIITFLYPMQLGYLNAVNIFQILAFGAVFYGTTVSISPIFFSMERPDIILKIAIVRVVVTVVVTLITIKPFGVIGAAIGGAGTGILVFGFWIFYMNRLINVKVDWKILLSIPVIGVCIILLAKMVGNIVHDEIMLQVIWILLLAAFSVGIASILKINSFILRLLSLYKFKLDVQR